MFLRSVLLALLVLICGCEGQSYFADIDVLERVGASRAADYTAADSIKSYRIESEFKVNAEGVPLKEWPFGFLNDFMPIEEIGPTLNKSQRARLLTILGSAATYILDDSEECECCYIDPEYGFEFCGSDITRFVFIGLRCQQVYFRGDQGENVLLPMKHDADDLGVLLGELFPSG